MTAFHVLSGGAQYSAADHHLGVIAYHGAKCVATRGISDESGEEKTGAQALAEYARREPGHSREPRGRFPTAGRAAPAPDADQDVAPLLADAQQKSHWIAAAKGWRRSGDLEDAFNDLHTWYAFGMNPHEAESSTKKDLPLEAQLHRMENSLARWMQDLWSQADKRGIRSRSKAGEMLKRLDEIVTKTVPAIVADIRAEVDK